MDESSKRKTADSFKCRIQRFSTEIERKEAVHSTLKKTFDAFDEYNDGTLSIYELRDALGSLDDGRDVAIDEARRALMKVANDRNKHSYDESKLKYVFNCFDFILAIKSGGGRRGEMLPLPPTPCYRGKC